MKIIFKRKLAKFGGSYRITIPKEIVDALNLKISDILNISLTNEGIIEIKKRNDGLPIIP